MQCVYPFKVDVISHPSKFDKEDVELTMLKLCLKTSSFADSTFSRIFGIIENTTLIMDHYIFFLLLMTH